MTSKIAFKENAPHLQALQALFKAHEKWFAGQDDFDSIVEMNQALIQTHAQELLVEVLSEDIASANMIRERYLAPVYDLETLLKYPQDSLGQLNPEEIPFLLDTIQRGWQMGKQAKQLFSQKWEQAWDKPVTQWRDELNILDNYNKRSPTA